MLRDFVKWGARPEYLFGVDLLADRVAEAIKLCPEGIKIRQGTAHGLNTKTNHSIWCYSRPCLPRSSITA